MKKTLFVIAAMTMVLTACNKGDDGNNGSGGNSDSGLVFVEDGKNWIGSTDKEWVAPVGDYTLEASKVYHLRGWVHLPEGASLTIPAGTVVRGTSTTSQPGASLIVRRGAKIYSNGTATKPVVFTSAKEVGARKSGDWGGIIILGRANNNDPARNMKIEGGVDAYHGGNDDNDNSGVIRYTRIEFAGAAFNASQANSEINGLTMGSVGRGTVINHVQVSYSCDDSYEWFGGSVDAKHLVAYHGWDDDFDTDNGFSGRLQFLLAVRHPKIADQSNSNGFESDNNSGGTAVNPYTSAQFCNVTLVGPIGQMASFTNNSLGGSIGWTPGTDAASGPFQAALHIRRKSHIAINNSVVFGFPIGLMLDCNGGADATNDAQNFAMQSNTIKNVIFAGYDKSLDAGYQFSNSTADASPLLGSDKNSNWTNGLCTDGGSVNASAKSLSFEYLSQPNTTRNNVVLPTIAELLLKQPVSYDPAVGSTVKALQNYGPMSGSPLLKSGLTVPSGFDVAGNGFYGAFKSDSDSDNWLAGWTNFDPQNAIY